MSQRIHILTQKQHILRIAGRVFAEKGYRDASVAEICKKAKVDTSLVNAYFGSKEQLYIAVWRDALQSVLAQCPFYD